MAKKESAPQFYVSRINTVVVNYEVYIMKATEKILYSLLLLLAGGCVGLIFYGGLFMQDGQATFATMISNVVVFLVVGLIAIKMFMSNVVEALRKKRLTKLRKEFCDFASTLTTALSSGMNMNDALNASYQDLCNQHSEEAMIVQEVREILNGINNNIPVEDMLADFGSRSGVPDIANFATVFATCYRTGGNIMSVVRRTSEIISEKTMIASEIETAVTSNKMQANIMNVLPIIIVLMMRLMSQEFAASFGTIIGVIGLTVSAGISIGAYRMSQKIMDIKG